MQDFRVRSVEKIKKLRCPFMITEARTCIVDSCVFWRDLKGSMYYCRNCGHEFEDDSVEVNNCQNCNGDKYSLELSGKGYCSLVSKE